MGPSVRPLRSGRRHDDYGVRIVLHTQMGARVAGSQRWLPAAWAVVLTVLVLGPALGPGFVLTYDMVWVPDLALRADALGLGPALPRAVPGDAVVAVLDEVLPGMLLQKLVLVASLVGAGTGTAALVPRLPVAARCAAVTVAIWNPYVVERLVLGHWTMVVSYAALPWLVLLAHRLALTGRLSAGLLLLAPLASLSPSAGLMVAVAVLVVVLVGAPGDRRGAALGRGAAVVLAANAPWLVSGLLHAGSAVSDPRAAELFALRGELLPAPLEALALGGVWNSEVVPASRGTAVAALGLAALVLLAAAGARGWWSATQPGLRGALVTAWAIGLLLALLTWALPSATAWLADEVPGGGLLRDGSRLLGLCVPLVASLVAHGTARLSQFLAVRWQQTLVAGSLALVPVALLPDAAWGAGLPRPVSYPSSWAAAAPSVAAGEGRMVVLPFTSYRQPVWNDGRKVLDPAGRYFSAPVVTSDRLVVDGVELEGEDPFGREVAAALAAGTAGERAGRLAEAGVARVLLERPLAELAPEVSGRVVLDNDTFTVLELDGPREVAVSRGWVAAMGAGWAAYAGMLVAGCALAMAAGRGRPARSGRRGISADGR